MFCRSYNLVLVSFVLFLLGRFVLFCLWFYLLVWFGAFRGLGLI